MSKPKTRTRNFERFQEYITQNVESWNKTRLSPLEIYAMNKYIIWGIFDAAAWILSTDEYYALNEWSEETYGFSGHGVRGGKRMKGYTFEMCQRCGERVPSATLKWTKDCQGISYRKVCRKCYEWYRARGYDGEYYTEADETIEPDEEVH